MAYISKFTGQELDRRLDLVTSLQSSLLATEGTIVNLGYSVSTIQQSLNEQVARLDIKIDANYTTLNNSIISNYNTLNNSIISNVSTLNNSIATKQDKSAMVNYWAKSEAGNSSTDWTARNMTVLGNLSVTGTTTTGGLAINTSLNVGPSIALSASTGLITARDVLVTG